MSNEDPTFPTGIPAADLEQNVSRSLDGGVAGKAAGDPRPLVRLTRIAPRSLDPDNVCEKFIIDAMRRAGLIAGDSRLEINLQVEQQRLVKGAQKAGTIIEIEWPS
jgi:hypothetical protein